MQHYLHCFFFFSPQLSIIPLGYLSLYSIFFNFVLCLFWLFWCFFRIWVLKTQSLLTWFIKLKNLSKNCILIHCIRFALTESILNIWKLVDLLDVIDQYNACCALCPTVWSKWAAVPMVSEKSRSESWNPTAQVEDAGVTGNELLDVYLSWYNFPLLFSKWHLFVFVHAVVQIVFCLIFQPILISHLPFIYSLVFYN